MGCQIRGARVRMQAKTEALLSEALKLPDDELDELFAGLVGRLARWDPDIEAAWIEEAEHRWQRLRSGATDTVPWAEVRAQALRNLD